MVLKRLPQSVTLLLHRAHSDQSCDHTKVFHTLRKEIKARENSVDPKAGQQHKNLYSASYHRNTKKLPLQNACFIIQIIILVSAYHSRQRPKGYLTNSSHWFNCFKSEPEHMSRNCSIAKKYLYCKANHNSIFCEKENNNEQQKIDSHSNSVNKTSCDDTTLLADSRTTVLLQTAVIDALAQKLFQVTKIWAIFHSGSQGSYISKRIREQLNLLTKGYISNVAVLCWVVIIQNQTFVTPLNSIYKIRDEVLIKALVKNNISTSLTDFKFQCKESYEY